MFFITSYIGSASTPEGITRGNPKLDDAIRKLRIRFPRMMTTSRTIEDDDHYVLVAGESEEMTKEIQRLMARDHKDVFLTIDTSEDPTNPFEMDEEDMFAYSAVGLGLNPEDYKTGMRATSDADRAELGLPPLGPSQGSDLSPISQLDQRLDQLSIPSTPSKKSPRLTPDKLYDAIKAASSAGSMAEFGRKVQAATRRSRADLQQDAIEENSIELQRMSAKLDYALEQIEGLSQVVATLMARLDVYEQSGIAPVVPTTFTTAPSTPSVQQPIVPPTVAASAPQPQGKPKKKRLE